MSCNLSSQLKSPEGRFLNIQAEMSSQDLGAAQDLLLTAQQGKADQQLIW
jgi:hypothetical protein